MFLIEHDIKETQPCPVLTVISYDEVLNIFESFHSELIVTIGPYTLDAIIIDGEGIQWDYWQDTVYDPIMYPEIDHMCYLAICQSS